MYHNNYSAGAGLLACVAWVCVQPGEKALAQDGGCMQRQAVADAVAVPDAVLCAHEFAAMAQLQNR